MRDPIQLEVSYTLLQYTKHKDYNAIKCEVGIMQMKDGYYKILVIIYYYFYRYYMPLSMNILIPIIVRY